VVATVRRLVEEKHAAPSQDALVEAAIRHYERQLQDAEDAERWASATQDAEFQAELVDLWAAYAPEDRDAWGR
jgi:hypothetical protein